MGNGRNGRSGKWSHSNDARTVLCNVEWLCSFLWVHIIIVNTQWLYNNIWWPLMCYYCCVVQTVIPIHVEKAHVLIRSEVLLASVLLVTHFPEALLVKVIYTTLHNMLCINCIM